MERSLIKQSDFARICNCERAEITRAIRKGVLRRDEATRRIDINDPFTIAYMENRARLAINKKDDVDEAPLSQQKTREEIGKIRDDRELKRLKIEESKGNLIERERVAAVLFNYIDSLNVNILDAPAIIYDYIVDKIKSDAPKAEVIEYMRDVIGREIGSTKKQLINRLEAVKIKRYYNDDEV